MRRTALLCLPAALLLGACGSESAPSEVAASSASSTPNSPSETTSATPETSAAPTPVDNVAADQALTRTLFYELSQSMRTGLQAHADYMSSHNHPDFAYSPADCLTGLTNAGYTETTTVDYVPDVTAMAPDEGWALSEGSGRYAGLVPSGRVYILPVTVSTADVGYSDSYTSQLHVSVVDDTPYFFFGCNEA